MTNKIVHTRWCVVLKRDRPQKLQLLPRALELLTQRSQRRIVRTFKQHCGETTSGGTNFQHELARHMNELGLKADPPIPVKLSDNSRSSVFESSAEAQRHGAEISYSCCALSEFQTHKNNERVSHDCCFLPLNCGVDL